MTDIYKYPSPEPRFYKIGSYEDVLYSDDLKSWKTSSLHLAEFRDMVSKGTFVKVK